MTMYDLFIDFNKGIIRDPLFSYNGLSNLNVLFTYVAMSEAVESNTLFFWELGQTWPGPLT